MVTLKFIAAVFLFVCCVQTAISGQGIIISEILASNASVGIDERNKTPDWIELCNTSGTSVSLKNWRISDKSNYKKAFQLPDTTLAPGQCLLVWASDYIDEVPGPTILEGAASGIGPNYRNDAFHFLYLPVTGDFDANIRIHNVHGGVFPEAGLIVREENKPLSRYTGVLLNTDGNSFSHIKPSINPDVDRMWFYRGSLLSYTKFPYAWIHLHRFGDSIVVRNSLDNYYWLEGPHYYFPFKNDTVFVGIAFVSGSDTIDARAGFSEFQINGHTYLPSELHYTAHGCRKPALMYPSKEIHAPFSLSQSGESIILWDSNGVIQDTLTFKEQHRNISYGIDDQGHHAWFAEPTPGRKNFNGMLGIVSDPVPTLTSGYYTTPVVVRTASKSDTSVQLRYTTDFMIPTEDSPLFPDSLLITKNTTLRLRAFSHNYIPSPVVNRTFIFEHAPSTGISTIFLTAEPDEFWSDSKGIWAFGTNADTTYPYNGAHFWENREAPIHVELSDGNKSVFAASMGAKNHGYAGRFNDQKPLDIQTSSPFGDGKITGTLFAEKPANEFQKLLLRNGSQDWQFTLLRDPLGSLLALRTGIDAQGYRPVRAYLDGDYWGMYQLREKSEESFIASNYNVDEDAVEMIGILGRPLQGNSADWNASVARALDTSITNDSVFAAVTASFDINNFIRYWAFELYAMNVDWPGNNLKAWRAGTSHPQWRYISLDNDLSFANSLGTDFNMFDYVTSPIATHWANRPEATAIFRGFMQNENFKMRFLSNVADFLNTVWSAPQTTALLDSLASQIEPEIPLHSARWPNSAVHWHDEVLRLREFLESRPDILRSHAVKTFGLPGLINVSLKSSVARAGLVTINSLSVPSGQFDGVYFRGVPIQLVVQPENGYEFVGWKSIRSNSIISTSQDFTIKSENDSLELVALYRQAGADSSAGIVINEIMYKAPDSSDTKDWIELYNMSDSRQSLSGWVLKDDDDTHGFTLPEGTTIAPHGYIVLAEDTNTMRTFYTYEFPMVGQFDFGFGRGDMVRLYDTNGKTVDSLRYERSAPWPTDADGNGSSLELIAPEFDNTLPQSWRASQIPLGTPGKRNSVTNPGSAKQVDEAPQVAVIIPNPTSGTARLKAVVSSPGDYRIEIFDTFGRTVWSYTHYFDTNEIALTLPTEYLTSGVYRCVVAPLSSGQIFSTAFLVVH